MSESVIIGIEDAASEDGATAQSNYADSASAQAGFPHSNALDQSVEVPFRAGTGVEHAELLTRFADLRTIGGGAVLGHNLSAKATAKAVLDPNYAVRPALLLDGVDDEATSATTIPQTADVTILIRAAFFPPSLLADTSLRGLLTMGASNERFRFSPRLYNSGTASLSPGELYLRVVHGGANAANIGTDIITYDGQFHDYAIVYDDPALTFWIYQDGVEVATGSASGSWVDEGLQNMRLSQDSIAKQVVQSLAVYDRPFAASEVADYNFAELDGTERGLIGGWNFTEGAGSTVADVSGNGADFTVTGGTWVEAANPFPAWSSGIRTAFGDWHRRDALEVGNLTEVTSPTIGAATRDLTISALVRVDPDQKQGSSTGHLFGYGPSRDAPEIRLRAGSTYVLSAESERGTEVTVNNPGSINDGVVRKIRATLRSVDNTSSELELFVDGVSQGTALTGAFDAAANCFFTITAGSSPEFNISDVRVFEALRSDEECFGPCDLSDPALAVRLLLDGDVVDDVDSSRSYTTSNIAYTDIRNPDISIDMPGRDGLGHLRAGNVQDQINRIVFRLPAEVEATEAYLQVWERANDDGFVEIGAAPWWSTWRPEKNRVYGAPRRYRKPLALRTSEGHPYLDLGDFSADGVAIRLRYLGHLLTEESESESDELIRRLGRLRSDLLVMVIWDPEAPEDLLVDRSVVGVISEIVEIADTDNFYAETELRFLGVL